MFKTLMTMVRGHAAAAGEEMADRNALIILDQQMRDSTAALVRAKRALALAIAQDNQEGRRRENVLAQIADLETRVTAALAASNEVDAREGAEAISQLEDECNAAQTARSLFAAEIGRLKAHVAQAESRIAALDRGRRIARAAEAVRGLKKGRIETALPHKATLSEAEGTLTRLRDRQAETHAAEEALDAIDASSSPLRAAEKLAAEGFGPSIRSTADNVLARLKANTAT